LSRPAPFFPPPLPFFSFLFLAPSPQPGLPPPPHTRATGAGARRPRPPAIYTAGRDDEPTKHFAFRAQQRAQRPAE